MNYYSHHIGDFNNATRHLSRIERSVYRDLIELYYDSEFPLTLDATALCRKIIAKSDEERTAVEQVLNEFFIKTPEGWRHYRCDDEIAIYHSNIKNKSSAGKASARKRGHKGQQASDVSSTDVQQTFNTCSTAVELPNNHYPITSNQEKQDTANAVFVPVELGDDIKPESVPTKQIIAKYHEHLPMGTRVALWNEQRAKRLRARWRESQERQDVQWWNDFFEHCARSKFLTGQVESPGRDPFVISLDWILTPSKFTKIFEGLYHREKAT